jgi:hypothetical protein
MAHHWLYAYVHAPAAASIYVAAAVLHYAQILPWLVSREGGSSAFTQRIYSSAEDFELLEVRNQLSQHHIQYTVVY